MRKLAARRFQYSHSSSKFHGLVAARSLGARTYSRASRDRNPFFSEEGARLLILYH